MRFGSGYLAALVIALASSQQIIQLLSHLPICAQQCIVDELGKLGCFAQNLTCSCGQKALITQEAGPCVVANCTNAELTETVNITDQVCDIYSSRVSSSLASVARTHTTSSTLLPISLSTTLATTTSSSSQSQSQSQSQTASSSSQTSSAAAGAAGATSPPQSKAPLLSTGAKAGIAVGAAIFGLLILTAIAVCVIGSRRRGKDLKHLAWIERRGTVRGRSELEVTQPEMQEQKRGGFSPPPPPPPVPPLPVAFAGDRERDRDRYAGDDGTERRDGDTLGTGTGTMSDIVSPVSPMERERSMGFREPGGGRGVVI